MKEKNEIILPLYYFPNLWWWHQYIQAEVVYFRPNEKYLKQTFRNRTCIKNPKGRLNLSIPVAYYPRNERYSNIRIADDNWKNHHYKSIYHNYRKSAFFEYYQEDIKVFFDTLDTDFIWEIAFLSIEWVLKKLKITPKHHWIQENETIHAPVAEQYPSQQHSFEVKPYYQLFGEFIHNLSALDALFCGGKEYF
jgi:hypothetical protein